MCAKGPRIQVDAREPAILTAELTYLGYQVENVQLEAGDFQGKNIIGEIKRNNDFYQSIIDERIYYQPQKMRQTGKECYWILAGDPTDERRHLQLVLDHLFQLILSQHITLLPVPNEEAAIAYAIHTIMSKKDKRRTKNHFDRGQTHIGELTLLQLIPGIGPASIQTVSNRYATIEQLVKVTQKELAAIPTIGAKRAQLIWKAVRRTRVRP
ncbi:MAG: hypothetical protein JSV04_02230 [Candidatus Heimdallarchaeota archaeon]|nr:MAG: hypothetical protein JSV04_02230 [Candidatus Heimdallarchaeota archaeon]